MSYYDRKYKATLIAGGAASSQQKVRLKLETQTEHGNLLFSMFFRKTARSNISFLCINMICRIQVSELMISLAIMFVLFTGAYFGQLSRLVLQTQHLPNQNLVFCYLLIFVNSSLLKLAHNLSSLLQDLTSSVQTSGCLYCLWSSTCTCFRTSEV